MNKPATLPDAEWAARCELAALYRLVAHHRMTDLIDTHISLRLPHRPEHFLINRYGVLFDKMRASDLVLIDHDGNVVDPHFPEHRVNRAGFVIHSALHAARDDLHCIIHTHTSAGIAVSAQQAGLLPISQHALKFYNRLAYHTYEGIALDTAERQRLVADMGPHKAMILRNHGLLAGGSSVGEAFMNIYMLERACQAQVAALSGGRSLNVPDPQVCEHTATQFDGDEESGFVELMWGGALTLIEDQQEHYCA